MKKLTLSMITVCALSSLFAYADNNGGNNDNGGDRPHGPPLEAIKACEGKSAGDTVQFQTPRGDTVSGTCKLIAVPDRLMGDDGGGQGVKNNQGQQGQGTKQ